ncbi:MAG TPA: tetratricopeptide repeat protein [Chitinispirillaceae bacterium]|nr:tetratricopeptide repeat protein [Chitinispirillaceae bacterium]
MNVRTFLPAALVCAVIQFQGCTNLTMLRTQELRDVKAQVDSLQSELTGLQKKMMDEQKSQSEVLRLIRADIQIRFNELDRKVSTIDGNLSENQFRLSKIDEKTAEFNKKLEARFNGDSANGNSRSSESEKMFQLAMTDFNAGRYDIALGAFQNLSNSESSLAQEAFYWVAECYYATKKYNDAEKGYLSYIKNYPQGAKLCVSLYKLGLVYERQNKEKSKNMAWKKLMEQCPDAQETSVVKAQTRN